MHTPPTPARSSSTVTGIRYLPALSLKDKKRQKYRLVHAPSAGKTLGAALAHPGETTTSRTATRPTATSLTRSQRVSPGRRYYQPRMSRPRTPRPARAGRGLLWLPDASRGAGGRLRREAVRCGAGTGEGRVSRLRLPAAEADQRVRSSRAVTGFAARGGLSAALPACAPVLAGLLRPLPKKRVRSLRPANACPEQGTSSSAIAGTCRGEGRERF